MNAPRPQITGHWAGRFYEADPSQIASRDIAITVPQAMPYRRLYFALTTVGKYAQTQRFFLRGYNQTNRVFEIPYMIHAPFIATTVEAMKEDVSFGLAPAFSHEIDAGVAHLCSAAGTELATGQTHQMVNGCPDAMTFHRSYAPGSLDSNECHRFTCYPFRMACELTTLTIECDGATVGTALQEDTAPGILGVLGCWSQNTPF